MCCWNKCQVFLIEKNLSKTLVTSLVLIFASIEKDFIKDQQSVGRCLVVTNLVHAGLIKLLHLECSFPFHLVQFPTFLPIPSGCPVLTWKPSQIPCCSLCHIWNASAQSLSPDISYVQITAKQTVSISSCLLISIKKMMIGLQEVQEKWLLWKTAYAFAHKMNFAFIPFFPWNFLSALISYLMTNLWKFAEWGWRCGSIG